MFMVSDIEPSENGSNPDFLSCILQTSHFASPLLNLILAADIRISSCLHLMCALKPLPKNFKKKKKKGNLKALAHFAVICFPRVKVGWNMKHSNWYLVKDIKQCCQTGKPEGKLWVST